MKFSYRRGWAAIALAALLLLSVSCGDDDDSSGGDGNGNGDGGGGGDTVTLTADGGDVALEIAFEGGEPTDGDVRRGGELVDAPSGTAWWGFEIIVRNTGDIDAESPDVGLACGDETPADIEYLDSPGFIEGDPPYSPASIGAGAQVTGVVPLAVPDDATGCRVVLRMDEAYSDASDPVEFSIE